MAGLGMAILGGALEEVGTGIADRGKALREAKLKELEQEREFQLRSREAGVSEDRADARTLASDQRQAAENEKNRDAQKTTYATDADGNQVMVRGSEATPVTMNGKPLRAATKAGDKPADQQMVEYLMGLGKSQEEALNWVKTSRTKSDEDSKLSLYKSILTANGGDSEAAQAETDRVWEKYGKSDSGGGKSDPGHHGPAPKTMNDPLPDAEKSASAIPSDPKLRVSGKLYKHGDKVIRWVVRGNESGWEPVN